MKTAGFLTSSSFHKTKISINSHSKTKNAKTSYTKLTNPFQCPIKVLTSTRIKPIKSTTKKQNLTSSSKFNESTSTSNHFQSQYYYSTLNKTNSSKIHLNRLNTSSQIRNYNEQELKTPKRYSSTFNVSNSINNQFKHIKITNKPIKKLQKPIANYNSQDITNHKTIVKKLLISEDNSPPININSSQSEESECKQSYRIEHKENEVMKRKKETNKQKVQQSNNNSNKISKKSSSCNIKQNYYNNNTATSDNTKNVLDETESNFLNYELGNLNNISKLPEISIPNEPMFTDKENEQKRSNKIEECEYDLNSVYKNIRQFRILNSFDSNSDFSIYHINTNELKQNETIPKIYIDCYNKNNKWENVNKTGENIMKETKVNNYNNLLLSVNSVHNAISTGALTYNGDGQHFRKMSSLRMKEQNGVCSKGLNLK